MYAGPPEFILTALKLAGGVTVRVAVFAPPNVAVIVTEAEAVTACDVTVKVAELALAATVTLAGTVAAAVLLLLSVTTVPPEGAEPFNVTVPVEFALPPTTLVGFNVKDVNPVAAGFTVSVADAEPLYVAVTTAVAEEVTVFEVTVNVADVALAATITDAGTVAAAVFPLESAIVTPPAGAALLSVTVAVEFAVPPIKLAGFSETDETTSEVTVKFAAAEPL